MYIHVTLVPYIPTSAELKPSPLSSVKELQGSESADVVLPLRKTPSR